MGGALISLRAVRLSSAAYRGRAGRIRDEVVSSSGIPSVLGQSAAGILLDGGILLCTNLSQDLFPGPAGFNLFVLHQMTGHDMFKIARWSIPQFAIMAGMAFVLVAIPEMATWLPKQMIPVS